MPTWTLRELGQSGTELWVQDRERKPGLGWSNWKEVYQSAITTIMPCNKPPPNSDTLIDSLVGRSADLSRAQLGLVPS